MKWYYKDGLKLIFSSIYWTVTAFRQKKKNLMFWQLMVSKPNLFYLNQHTLHALYIFPGILFKMRQII